jgi:hypothetical protein
MATDSDDMDTDSDMDTDNDNAPDTETDTPNATTEEENTDPPLTRDIPVDNNPAPPLFSATLLRRDDIAHLAGRARQHQQGQTEPDPTRHNQFIPAIAFPLTSRPDGVLYEFLDRKNWNQFPDKTKIKIHLIELYVSSTAYFQKKRQDKTDQYKHTIEWLRAMGYENIELHHLPFTFEGFIPKTTTKTLRKLGVSRKAIIDLKITLERQLIESARDTKWKRRQIETHSPFKDLSGFVRYILHRKHTRRRT